MVRTDSYEPGETTYECTGCLNRVQSGKHPGECSECGGQLRNITVPRE